MPNLKDTLSKRLPPLRAAWREMSGETTYFLSKPLEDLSPEERENLKAYDSGHRAVVKTYVGLAKGSALTFLASYHTTHDLQQSAILTLASTVVGLVTKTPIGAGVEWVWNRHITWGHVKGSKEETFSRIGARNFSRKLITTALESVWFLASTDGGGDWGKFFGARLTWTFAFDLAFDWAVWNNVKHGTIVTDLPGNDALLKQALRRPTPLLDCGSAGFAIAGIALAAHLPLARSAFVSTPMVSARERQLEKIPASILFKTTADNKILAVIAQALPSTPQQKSSEFRYAETRCFG